MTDFESFLKSPHCPRCSSNKIRKNGFYRRQRNRRQVQRYQCGECRLTFSDQSFHITYRQKRPDLLEEIMKTTCNGVGIRRSAVVLKTTVTTIQKKIKLLALICESFHDFHMRKWTKKPKFQFDEMWAIEGDRENPLTIPVAIERDSYFIVAAQSAHTHSKISIPSAKAENDRLRMHKIILQNNIIENTLRKCRHMKPKGRIYIETDKKTNYPTILENVFGKDWIIHKRFDSKLESERLFPINNTMACMRSEKPMLRRRSWHFTKDTTWLNHNLHIYMVFYNYIRKKKYTKSSETLNFTNPKTGEIRAKTFRTFAHKTPAMQLGIFDDPISFEFIIKNCGLKFHSSHRLTEDSLPQGDLRAA